MSTEISILIILLLIFMFVVSLLFNRQLNKMKKNCTQEVKGTIKEIVREAGNLYPVYSYQVEGFKYTKKATYKGKQTPQVGKSITVLYDPSKPETSYIKDYDDKTFHMLSIIFMIISIIGLCLFIYFKVNG